MRRPLETATENARELQREVRCGARQPVEVFGQNAHHAAVAKRADGCGARLPQEKRQIPHAIAAMQEIDELFTLTLSLNDDLGNALRENVEILGHLSLADKHRPPRKVNGLGPCCTFREYVVRNAFEELACTKVGCP